MREKIQSSSAHQMGTLQPNQFPIGNKNEQRTENEKLTKKTNEMDLKELDESTKKEWLNHELVESAGECSGGIMTSYHRLTPGLYYVEPKEKTKNNYKANKAYQENKETYERYMKEKAYFIAVFLLRNGCRMDWFYERYKSLYDELGENGYYELLAFCYLMQKTHYSTRHFYSELIGYGKNPSIMMEEEEKAEFEKLPEKIVVYRGIKLQKRITKRNLHNYVGNAWTTSLEMAISYAGYNMKQILKLEIMKSNAIAYFGSATCNDVFIDFEKNPHLESQIQIIDASKIIDAS